MLDGFKQNYFCSCGFAKAPRVCVYVCTGEEDGACFRYTPVSLLSKGDLFNFFIKGFLADDSPHAVLLALGSQKDL